MLDSATLKRGGRWRHTKYTVSDEHAFVYFVVPKVACSSIKTALLPLFGMEEPPDGAHDVHGLFDRSPCQIDKTRFLDRRREYDELFKFVFVRDPWDRLVSCWRQKLAPGGEGLGREEFAGRRFGVGMPFGEFAEAVCAVPDEESDRHFHSQHVTACGNGKRKRLLADFVGRYENRTEDFALVAGKIGAEPELPHLLPTRGGASYRDLYNRGLAAMVGERYRLDAEIFGYRF